jgi:hypothetical protein
MANSVIETAVMDREMGEALKHLTKVAEHVSSRTLIPFPNGDD